MVDYAPGMRTIIRDEEWMVKKVEKNNMGNNALYCVGVSPLVKDKEAVFLTDLEEIAVVDPKDVKLVIDGSSFFRRTQLYLESQWRQQIPTDTDLHIGDKAAMDLMPYQLEPTQISLRRPRQRILIADTVGLGKTLEAGILMSELIARGKGRRILVVTVKSMMTQFQKEMWNRFTIPLVRLDSKKIHDIRTKLPSVKETHGGRRKPMKEVPIWEKSNLSLEEAAAYSGIGINKLRELTNEKNCRFVLWVGNKRLIKRRLFDQFIEQEYSI